MTCCIITRFSRSLMLLLLTLAAANTDADEWAASSRSLLQMKCSWLAVSLSSVWLRRRLLQNLALYYAVVAVRPALLPSITKYYHDPRIWLGNAFGRVCLCVCLTSESLHPETSFFVYGCMLIISRSAKEYGGDDDDDDDDEIAYFTVRWKTRASFVYRTKNMR